MSLDFAPEAFVTVANEMSQCLQNDSGSVAGISITDSVPDGGRVLSDGRIDKVKQELAITKKEQDNLLLRMHRAEKLLFLVALLGITCVGAFIWVYLQNLSLREELQHHQEMVRETVSWTLPSSPLEGMGKTLEDAKDTALKVFKAYVDLTGEVDGQRLYTP